MLSKVLSLWGQYIRQSPNKEEVQALFTKIATEIIDVYLVEGPVPKEGEESSEHDFGNEDYEPSEHEVIDCRMPGDSALEIPEMEYLCNITSFPDPEEGEKYHLIDILVGEDDTGKSAI